MAQTVPENLKYFLKNGLEDSDDGFEYASELNRILNSDECQLNLSPKEIQALKDFADDVKKVGEFNYYSKDKVRNIEIDSFGNGGILGYLGDNSAGSESKIIWPF